VRLVKGAYWDSEVKRAQVEGQAGYPVFTRKPNTDVSYQANARRLLEATDAIYPMFATHNAQTIAAIHRMAQAVLGGARDGDGRFRYEFQKLHGMGDDLYAEVIPADRLDVPCRVYAPVGSHEDLLPYLVRRLLENGANSSFVNRITDEGVAIDDLVRDPVDVVAGFMTGSTPGVAHPRIPLPRDIYRAHGQDRDNSMGLNLANDDQLRTLAAQVNAAARGDWRATPLVPGARPAGATTIVNNPADRRETVGQWLAADSATVELALRNAVAAQPAWDALPAASRAVILERAADLLEQRMPQFIALCTKEAGKTIPDGVAEVREAVDFLRYYAGEARKLFAHPETLPGPTGESNTLQLSGRGVFVCISPWNFPLAIFAGQIAAALAAGNSVLAKPAEQTNLVGYTAIKLLHEAGVPEAVLQFLPGDGATVGAALTRDARVAGVAFTGSTDTARAINRALAARDSAIGVLIAETGGQNALIGDSSALPEQLVKDALASAFTSAGQRCSAARVLFVQDDIADKVVAMLAGAMAELKVGDPGLLSTDIGPVIDSDALCTLDAHSVRMRGEATLIAQAQLDPETTAHGSFFAPSAWQIDSITRLQKEVFGPALHVVRWKAEELDLVIDAINATGYGLTLGIHSRIDETIERIVSRARVGNAYVNRNQIGAVVGVQPFGGQGLSGTGPKAGGPHYLPRFATEKTVTINTTAAGGNASLLTLGE
jgi:RHH-type proline utilization regulon transcriptional repressor/proline dehydrogenase/delta 1-pyrroline-5-carboxylate dehydrogenase